MVQAGCVRLAFSRASTSSAVDFIRGPKTLFGEFFGGRQRSAGGVDFGQGLVGGLGFHLPFAQRFSVFSASGSVDL